MARQAAGFQAVDEATGVWAFEYLFSGPATANTQIIRGRDGGLVVVSPACGMSNEDFARIDALGRVSAIVAPNRFHHLGQQAWQDRYPEARVFAPAGASRTIAKKHDHLRPFEPIEAVSDLLGPGSWFGIPPHMRMSDLAGWVKTPEGYIWCFTDMVVNFRSLPKGAFGKLLGWTRSAPGLAVFRLAAPLLLKSRKGYKAWLLEELARQPPIKIVSGHGALVLDREQAQRLPEIVERSL